MAFVDYLLSQMTFSSRTFNDLFVLYSDEAFSELIDLFCHNQIGLTVHRNQSITSNSQSRQSDERTTLCRLHTYVITTRVVLRIRVIEGSLRWTSVCIPMDATVQTVSPVNVNDLSLSFRRTNSAIKRYVLYRLTGYKCPYWMFIGLYGDYSICRSDTGKLNVIFHEIGALNLD